MKIKKVGRTTELTEGVITNVGATLIVQGIRGRVLYKDQIIGNDKAAGGDSGSLLLDMNNNVVGLTVCTSGDITMHNPINTVLRQLDVRLVTG